MPEFSRGHTEKVVQEIRQGKVASVYLLVGERFLARQFCERLLQEMIPESSQRAQNVTAVDGEKEGLTRILALVKTYSLFPGRQVVQVSDFPLFGPAKSNNDEGAEDENDTKNKNPTNAADDFEQAIKSGLPPNNTLVLLAQQVDKRKKVYKLIKKEHVVVDLSVAAGSTKAAQKDQEAVFRELVTQTLKEFGTAIEPKALVALFERTGFHPVAAVREAEKLALYTEGKDRITLADLEAIVGRTREDALFELTEAVSGQDLSKALSLTSRMLESGFHPLAIVASLRRHFQQLLLVGSWIQQMHSGPVDSMSFGSFQKGYLPGLKEEKGEQLKKLPNHPYALFMVFQRAARFSTAQIMGGLSQLLEAEYRLKSSSMSGKIVLENFFFSLLVKGKSASVGYGRKTPKGVL